MTPNQWRVANKRPYLEKIDYLWYDVNRVTVTRRSGEYKGELQMRISYNKLQKLMIDNQMKRQDLMRAAEISSSVATKLNKNETVSLDVLMRICKVFHCDIGDICEVILDE